MFPRLLAHDAPMSNYVFYFLYSGIKTAAAQKGGCCFQYCLYELFTGGDDVGGSVVIRAHHYPIRVGEVLDRRAESLTVRHGAPP